MTWQTHAACRGMDPDLFFPERGDISVSRDARLACVACPVRQQCLDYALDNGETIGIWGGLSGRERRILRKLRAAGAVEATELPPPPPPLEKRPARRRSKVVACGTYAGYKHHFRVGEPACADCRRANADYRVTWLERQRKGQAS